MLGGVLRFAGHVYCGMICGLAVCCVFFVCVCVCLNHLLMFCWKYFFGGMFCWFLCNVFYIKAICGSVSVLYIWRVCVCVCERAFGIVFVVLCHECVWV